MRGSGARGLTELRESCTRARIPDRDPDETSVREVAAPASPYRMLSSRMRVGAQSAGLVG